VGTTVPRARRSDTSNAIWLSTLRASVTSTDARKRKSAACGGPTHRLQRLPKAVSRPNQVHSTLSGIRISLPSQSPLTFLNSEVVQPGSSFHDRIGNPFPGVPKDVLHDATALHARESMLHPDPNPRQLPVRPLLSGGEFPSGRLFFFAWRVSCTAGSYPWNPASLYNTVPGG
jgi:hypothetical protein